MVSVGNQSLDGKVSFVESRLASKLLKVSRKMLRRNVQRAVFWSNFLGSSECSNRFKGQYMQIQGNTICSKSTYRYCDFKRFGHADALRSKPECCHSRIVVVKPSSEDMMKICKLGRFLAQLKSHGLTCWLAFYYSALRWNRRSLNSSLDSVKAWKITMLSQPYLKNLHLIWFRFKKDRSF